MKYILLIIISMSIATNVFANTCSKFKSKFSSEQFSTLTKSYHYGLRYDMEQTLTALAWTESSAGLFLGSGDPSYGVYQAYLPTVINRLDLDYDPIIHNLLKHELKNNESFYTAHAITEILFWKKRRVLWWSTWASYNGGYRYENDAPQRYASKIYKRAILIGKCSHLFLLKDRNSIDKKTFELVKEYSGVSPKKIKEDYAFNFLLNYKAPFSNHLTL
jgi:hypothetical protein